MIDLFLHAAILTTTPILLAALGGLINRIGGLVNLGLESMMLAGALVAVEVSSAASSAALGTVAAGATGALIGLAMSLVITRLRANEIIVGLGFTVAVAGLVRYLLKSLYGVSGTYNPPGSSMLPRLDIPFLDGVPFLGAIVSHQDALTWFAWAMVPAIALALTRTRWGLRLRATGSAEATVRAVGLAPLRIRDVIDGVRRRHGRPGRRLFVDRDRWPIQRGDYGRAGVYRAGGILFRAHVAGPHGVRGSAVRVLRCGADPASRSWRPCRTRPNAALCHRHRGVDWPRGRRLARRTRKDALMASPNSQSADSSDGFDPRRRHQLILCRRHAEPLSGGERSARPLRRLLAAARAAGRIVVHAVERHYPGFDDYEWRKLPQHHFIGDADAAFVDGFSPSGPREIVCAKRRYSAFFATDLALFLREQKIERVIVAGVKTNVCIRATAQDAFAHGFDVIIPREATNSNRPHLAEASLEDIERYFGAVVTLDRALEMLA